MITKRYRYSAFFDVGSSTFFEQYRTALNQACDRANRILTHRISVRGYEDGEDGGDEGLASERVATACSLLEASGVDPVRFEKEIYIVSTENESRSDDAAESWLARRVEIELFPRVGSLFPGLGDMFLTRQEVSLLETVRSVVLFGDEIQRRLLQERYDGYDWRRVTGYTSLAAWDAQGALHPIYIG